MRTKSKVVERLNQLIDQIPWLEKEGSLYSSKYDLWKRKTGLLLDRVCSKDIVKEFQNIVKREPQLPRRGFLWGTTTIEERIERYMKKRDERNKLEYRVQLCLTKNLLTAIKENIEFFESDEETKKEAEKIKRKFEEIEVGIPGLLKYKRAKETEKK